MALPYDISAQTIGDATEVQANFDDLDTRVVALGAFSDYFNEDADTTTGLTWGYKAARVRDDNDVTDVAAGTVLLDASATNYVEIDPSTGTVSANTTGFTTGLIPLRILTTDAGSITNSTDKRSWLSAGTAGGGASDLDDLDDVTITAAASGDFLRHNGTAWVDGAIAASDLPTGIDAAKIANGSVSSTEFQYLDGVTSGIQSQLNGKANTSHAHAIADVTSLQSTLDAKAAATHSHAISDVTNLQSTLDGKASTSHTHNASDINAGTMGTPRLGSGTANSTTFLRGDNTWATPTAAGDGAGRTEIAPGYAPPNPQTLTETEAASLNIEFTGSTWGPTWSFIMPTVRRMWRVYNNTSSTTITIKTAAQTGGVTLAAGTIKLLECDGTNVAEVPISYTAADAGDWATSPPATLAAAIDRIAAALAIETGAPIP